MLTLFRIKLLLPFRDASSGPTADPRLVRGVELAHLFEKFGVSSGQVLYDGEHEFCQAGRIVLVEALVPWTWAAVDDNEVRTTNEFSVRVGSISALCGMTYSFTKRVLPAGSDLPHVRRVRMLWPLSAKNFDGDDSPLR